MIFPILQILDKLRADADFRYLLDQPDLEGYTPLHHAVIHGYYMVRGYFRLNFLHARFSDIIAELVKNMYAT